MEHGFLSFSEILPLAETVRDKTASYLRQAIVALLEFTEDLKEFFQSPYDKPLGTTGYIRQFNGYLLSEHDDLAATDQKYPILNWKFQVKSFSISDDGKFNLSYEQEISPRVGEGVSLQASSIEIFGPEGIIVDPQPKREHIKPIVSKPTDKLEFKETIEFLESVKNAVTSYVPKGYCETNPTDTLVLLKFSRALGLFEGITLLLKNKISEEGMILARSLYIESLHLLELAASKDQKAAKLLGWENQSISTDRKLILEASNLGLEKNVRETLEMLENRREKLQRFARDIGIQRLGTFSSEKDASVRFRNLNSYWTYLLSHQMVYGTTGAHAYRVKKSDENTFLIHFHNDDPQIIGEIGGFSAESVLLSCNAARQIFGWKEMDNYNLFLQKAQALIAKNDDENATIN
ncbi:MAG: hypothetical protein NPIRA02_22000 [Nitrospirales bacterium]|nr:MAG: hypothetical protein NPIRA02_22000 [Nitrospirales bacterium]